MADIPAGLELLRQEVPTNLVGKLPKVTCYACRQKENRGECKEHRKRKCEECGAFLTTAHMHLDYVGHAETTSKLLEADPMWNWEPLAFGQDGLPQFDPDGGLWIKLTVCGVTRLGYGTADNANGFKARGDIRKEIIGDALRNAAMRFGWALNLWAKTDIHERTPQDESAPTPQEEDPWATAPMGPSASAPANASGRPKANTALLKAVNTEVGKRVGSNREDRLGLIADIIGRPITSSSELTRDEGQAVLASLARAAEQNAAPAEPPMAPNPRNSNHPISPEFEAALATPNLSQLVHRAAEQNQSVGTLLYACITSAQLPQELKRLFDVAVQGRDGGHISPEEFAELDELGRAATQDMARARAAQPAGVTA